MPGRLFVVATPIGNLDDITIRALSTLKAVSLVAAEDTRRTTLLLRHFAINTPLTSLHEHNERQKLSTVLDRLKKGEDVALVSDAGTPLIADPGHRLIQAAVSEGVQVVPIPGASAVMAALEVSAFPADEFTFAGFVPSRSNDRITWFQRLRLDRRTLVFFETPHRIEKTLALVSEYLADRPICICRELTKLHEEVIRVLGKDALTVEVRPQGEFTLVAGPENVILLNEQPTNDTDVYNFFCRMIETGRGDRRAALRSTAAEFGLSTNKIYAVVERMKRPRST